jgi:hypothetical protein
LLAAVTRDWVWRRWWGATKVVTTIPHVNPLGLTCRRADHADGAAH